MDDVVAPGPESGSRPRLGSYSDRQTNGYGCARESEHESGGLNEAGAGGNHCPQRRREDRPADVVELLLKAGASPGAGAGDAILPIARSLRSPQVVKLLVAFGAK